MFLEKIGTEFDPVTSEFTRLYCEAFAGPPYFEKFSPEEVLSGVWTPHLQADGMIIVAEKSTGEVEDTNVVGLVCGHHALSNVEPAIKDFLLSLEKENLIPAPLAHTLFISELCVDSSVRKKGLGTTLTLELLTHAKENGYTHWMTRTAAEGSNSLRIFQGLGGQPFGPRHRVGDTIATASDERVYLYGDLTNY